MKKFNATFYQELSKKKYMTYIRSLPDFRNEKTQVYGTLILTIIAFSFFGIFAITPTLSTIFELQKKHTDLKFVNEQLETKNTNLSLLQERYNQLAPNLSILNAAIPDNAQVTILLGQIQTLAQKNGLAIKQLRAEGVELASDEPVLDSPLQSYIITLDASATYEQLTAFYNDIVRFDRIVTLESITTTREVTASQPLRIVISAKAYFFK
jgi:Tfp pilus assembly protein PilO